MVIDRYAELEDARLRRVASDEGRKLAAALEPAAPPPRPKLAVTPSDPQPASHFAVAELAEVVPFDPASDPLLPEEPVAPVYVDGALKTTLRGENLVPRFLDILDTYVAERYGGSVPASAGPVA